LGALLAIAYPNEGTAERAAEEVRHLRAELGVEPDAVAVIARSAQGEYRATTSHHPVEQGSSWGMFWGLLFGLLFFAPVFGSGVGLDLGGVFAEMEKGGINRAFQQQVRDMVAPGTSALFLFISTTDRQRAVDLLSDFGGRIVEVSLSDACEARLQQAVHGSLSASRG
jgi:uncharacterized membrane protein